MPFTFANQRKISLGINYLRQFAEDWGFSLARLLSGIVRVIKEGRVERRRDTGCRQYDGAVTSALLRAPSGPFGTPLRVRPSLSMPLVVRSPSLGYDQRIA